MNTHPAFSRMMNRSVTVKRATLTLGEFREQELDDLTAISGSPLTARIEDTGGVARDDPFWDYYPEATHRMWWAVGTVLKAGDRLEWTDAESTTRKGVVMGPPINEGGANHHYMVGIDRVELEPSGVS